ncbi:MAG: MBOAT family O-acyltransferase [Anaerocolumna sp.]
MVFSSLEFIFRFLPIFLILYYIVPKVFKNGVLIIGSLGFYAWGDLKYVSLILLSVLVNHLFVYFMNKHRGTTRSKLWLMLALFFDFGLLFFFKYINFVMENLNHITREINGSDVFLPLQIGLPLGISFYTFQVVSFVVDSYRGNIENKPTLYRTATYILMFPKLVSGPIASYSFMETQLIHREYSLLKFESGLKTFVIGLGMKVIIANRIGILWNDIQTIGFESISTPLAWFGAIGYSLQLYFDFYGYSLMAVGVGRMIGFELPENFREPYMAKSVTEFWRRWHMSLGTWFKDYIYIPLGGNRCSKGRVICNLLVVWLFTGLWHGANWNFVLWGLYLFVLILIEKLFIKKYLDRTKVICRLYLLFVILVSWILFAISNLNEVGIYLGRMLGVVQGINVNHNDFIKFFGQYKWLFLVGIFLCFPYGKRLFEKFQNSLITTIILLVVFWYSIYMLANGVNNPFLYFQF